MQVVNPLEDHKLYKLLISLELPKKEFAIFGSAIMYILGLKEEMHDLDIIARNEAWTKAKKLGKLTTADSGDERIEFFEGEIEVFNEWWESVYPGAFDIDELIDNSKEINGIKVVGLKEVYRSKTLVKREKDKKDLVILNKYLKANSYTI